jgi:hypothetical protein
MSDAIQELFEALRSACSSGTWSRGVELVRADAVTGEADEGDEISLRVSTRGGLICPTVILMPGDAEWECDTARARRTPASTRPPPSSRCARPGARAPACPARHAAPGASAIAWNAHPVACASSAQS